MTIDTKLNIFENNLVLHMLQYYENSVKWTTYLEEVKEGRIHTEEYTAPPWRLLSFDFFL